MVYDSARGKVVMFGGGDGGYLNDTWTFDCVQFEQQLLTGIGACIRIA